MKKNFLIVTAIMVCALAGCGKTDADLAPVETQTETVSEIADEVSTEVATEAAVEETSAAVSSDTNAEDMKAYASIIETIPSGSAYAFAHISENANALLVTDYTYTYEEDLIAAIDATIYFLDADGNPKEYGKVMSDGTGYPLSLSDNLYLMYGGNHHMAKTFIDAANGSMMTKEDAEEVFDTDGNATYYYFSLDEEFEGEVEDNSKLTPLYDEFHNATIIPFTVVE